MDGFDVIIFKHRYCGACLNCDDEWGVLWPFFFLNFFLYSNSEIFFMRYSTVMVLDWENSLHYKDSDGLKEFMDKS